MEWTKTNFVMPCSNTETSHLVGMDFPQPRSSMAILPKTPFLSIVIHFNKNGNSKCKKLRGKLMPHKNPSLPTCYSTHGYPLTEIEVGSNVAIQNPRTKLWDIYGTIIDVSPNRRYYIKTSSGRVLVQNHRFLYRKVPLSTQLTTRFSCRHHYTTPPLHMAEMFD